MPEPPDRAITALPTGAASLKGPMRRQALARRAAVASDTRHAMAAVLATRAVQLVAQAVSATPVVSAYYPIRDEADTLPLLAALAAQGLATALPVTVGRGQKLVFRLWKPGDPLTPGQMHIPEPPTHLPGVDPDVLFVPLAAFDRQGNRIGYGAGHYDRTLAALRGKKRVLAVGVAYATQEVDEVPCEVHDAKLDFVLTERELIDCRA